jgi:biotin carboxyl carrier protein
VIFDIELAGKKHRVDATQSGERETWTIDGRGVAADAVEIAPGVYSLVIAGQSIEVRVEKFASKLRVTVADKEYEMVVRDPREWKRSGGGAAEAEGRAQIMAPMPGKVIRLLVSAGDAVEAGQGIVVVEAMKMQNEIRTRKSGKVEKLAVAEGQTVNAGDLVAIIG